MEAEHPFIKESKISPPKKLHSESSGCLNKCWFDMMDHEILINGNTITDTHICYEPFSEVIACHVAKALGLNVVEYAVADKAICPDIIASTHVSLCERIPLEEGEQNGKR